MFASPPVFIRRSFRSQFLWRLLFAFEFSRMVVAAPTTAPSVPRVAFLPFGIQGQSIPPQPVQLGVSARSIELLGKQFQNERGPERVIYARELGHCGKDALSYLLIALSDPDPNVRAESVRSVGMIADPLPTERIAAMLNDPDSNVRREAVLTLAALGASSAITRALDDRAELVRMAALDVVTTPRQADHIADSIPQWPDEFKPFAAAALGRMRAVRHGSVLASMLQADPVIRAAAIRALGQMNSAQYQDSIAAMLKDSCPTVRRQAMLALPGTATVQSQQSLAIAGLDDPDPTVREASARVLQIAPTPAAIDELCVQLADSYEPLHLAARQALAVAGGPVIPIAEAMLSDPNPRRREDGSFLLGAYASNASLGLHIALLDDADWGVVDQAAKSLYNLASPAEITGPYILRILQRGKRTTQVTSTEIDAQAAAILLAGRIGYTSIIALAEPMIPNNPFSPTNAPDQFRVPAIWAIGMTAGPRSHAASLVEEIYQNPEQSPAAVFESFKAMVNMNDASAKDFLKNWDNDSDIGRDNNSRWMAHYAYDFFSGRNTPFVPRPYIMKVDLSIQDISNQH